MFRSGYTIPLLQQRGRGAVGVVLHRATLRHDGALNTPRKVDYAVNYYSHCLNAGARTTSHVVVAMMGRMFTSRTGALCERCRNPKRCR